MTSIISDFKFSRNVCKLGLLLSYDKKHHPVLNIGNENYKILMKKFCGRFDLDKFLVEAVIMRMGSSKENLKEVHNFYNCLCSFAKEKEIEANEKI